MANHPMKECAFCGKQHREARLFCFRCLPPFSSFPDPRDYNRRYSKLYACLKGTALSRCRIPAAHPAMQVELRCSYRDCGASFLAPRRYLGKTRFCSTVCKEREKYARRIDSGAIVLKGRPAGPVQVVIESECDLLSVKRFRSSKYWQSLRSDVFERHGEVCYLCGKAADTIDHVIPIVFAPHLADDLDNLRPACRKCNSSKGSTPPLVAILAAMQSGRMAHPDWLVPSNG